MTFLFLCKEEVYCDPQDMQFTCLFPENLCVRKELYLELKVMHLYAPVEK